MSNEKSKKIPVENTYEKSRVSQSSPDAPRYEKPRVRIYAPLHEMTFLSGFGATGVGVIVSVSGGGH